MSNHKPNGIRAHNNRHAIANDPDNLHAMSNHTQNETQGAHTDRHTITPPGFRIYDKPNLTASIPMGNSWAVALFCSRFAQNHNLL